MSLFGFLRRNKDDDGYEADDDNDVWVVDKYDGEEYLLLEWEDGYWYYEKDDSVTLFFQESANETPVRFGSFAYDDNGFPDLESRLTDVEDDDEDDDDDYEDGDDDEDDEDDVPYEDDEGNWAVIDKYDGAEYILLELDDEHWYYKKSDSAVVFLQESDDEDIPPVRLGSYAYNDEGLPDLDSDPLTDAEDDDDDDDDEDDDDEDDEDAAYQDDDGNWAALDENGEQHQLTNCFDGFWYYQQIGSLSLFQESDGGIPVRLGSIPILDDSEVVPPQPVAYDVGDY